MSKPLIFDDVWYFGQSRFKFFLFSLYSASRYYLSHLCFDFTIKIHSSTDCDKSDKIKETTPLKYTKHSSFPNFPSPYTFRFQHNFCRIFITFQLKNFNIFHHVWFLCYGKLIPLNIFVLYRNSIFLLDVLQFTIIICIIIIVGLYFILSKKQ